MPENYYCLDNFFHKVTDMESPRKNNDCYFYYYSTCTKGDSCTFRHEPSALGCETTCSFWKEGKCINVRCNFRHMELRKNRKVIPCYWESQPGGCLKPHCPFLHQNPKHPSLSENQGETSDIKTQDLNKGTAIQNTDTCSKNASQGNEKNFGSPVVDPLVVNFEEESDNESAPTQSPVKLSRIVKVKTLEEIRLERIQAESAAYYSYPDTAIATTETADDLRKRIIRRLNMKTDDDDDEVEGKQQEFQVLSLNEIRNRKKKFSIPGNIYADEEESSKKAKLFSKLRENDLSQVKIKTLEEIRAERAKKFAQVYMPVTSSSAITHDANADHASSDSEVSSTSKCDTDIINLLSPDDVLKTQCIATIQPMKRLKRKLILGMEDRNTVKIAKFSTMLNVESLNTTTIQCASPTEVNKTILDVAKIDAGIDIQKEIQSKEVISDNERSKDRSALLDSNKLDEVLLLDEEEFESNEILKAEEDILKDIDELLNE